MPRHSAVRLVFVFALLVTPQACAAPAPFSRQPRPSDDALFVRLREAVHNCGYRLQGVRPGPREGEYALVISDRSERENDPERTGPIATEPVALQHLMRPETLVLILERAEINHLVRRLRPERQTDLPIQHR